MASGETIYQIQRTDQCGNSKRVDIAVYVNPDRCPRITRKAEEEKKSKKCKRGADADDEDDE